MFEGFQLETIDTGEAQIRVRHGGSGSPLLLLHGHPQTHMMWHRVAARLAQEFTVVTPDLRGYGESSKPPTTGQAPPTTSRSTKRTGPPATASAARFWRSGGLVVRYPSSTP